MTKKDFCMKILIDEKYFDFEKELENLKPQINFSKIADRDLAQIRNSEVGKTAFDIFIFDLREDINQSSEILKEVKKYNPNIRAIAFTSKKNGRYQGSFLFRSVDLFLYKEKDKEFLLSYLKKAHLRLSKGS